MAVSSIEKENQRNRLYQRMFPLVWQLLTISAIGNVVLCVLGLYVATSIPQPAFFATSERNLTLPLAPMEMPNQSDAAVLQWAIEAGITLNTYDFLNFNQEIGSTRSFFTSDGWASFLEALAASKTREMVTSEKLIASAVVTQMPIMLASGMIDGVYSWRVQMVMLITYQVPGSEPKQVSQMVTMLIKRISTTQDPRGIGIDQILIGEQGQVGS